MVPMQAECEDEEYYSEVDESQRILPRCRPWILFSHGVSEILWAILAQWYFDSLREDLGGRDESGFGELLR